ncbi:Succinoglycan biosynthesis protein ExoI [Chlorella vulgaris]
MLRRGVLSLLLAAATLASGAAAQAGDSRPLISGVPDRISDGDTLSLLGSRIRLRGVDAPELAQTCLDASGSAYPCGEVSRDALRAKVGDSSIDCRQEDQDQYGRVVAVCYLPLSDGSSLDLNGWLVQQGLAVAYRRAAAAVPPAVWVFTQDYAADENAAREAGRGLWAGEFQMPADFRRFGPAADLSGATPDASAGSGANGAAPEDLGSVDYDGDAYDGVYEGVAYDGEWNASAPAGSAGMEWNGATGSTADEQELPADAVGDPQGEQAAAAAEGGGGSGSSSACDIKGNISASGDRIYHVPGSPAYDSTVIDQGSGERWFCSAAEAEAAGWRAPRGR